MKTEDKKTLYRLLNEYMIDLLKLDEENIKRRKDRKKKWVACRKLSYIRSKGAV